MKVIKCNVKARVGTDKKAKTVAVVEVPEFESLDEARGQLGDEAVLSLVNTQNGTNIKNRARQGATAGPSVAQLEALAIGELAQSGELMKVAGDPVATRKAIDDKVKVLKAKAEADRAAALSNVQPVDDEDDSDDDDDNE